MIFITQLIYIKEGEEQAFLQFETLAIPLISKYKGNLLLRVRPEPSAIIEKTIESPYEIHLVEFETASDFQAFMQDAERKKFLHLKEQSVRMVVLVQGRKLNA